jgi:FMN phosphatase YigB (HAD superfamily)
VTSDERPTKAGPAPSTVAALRTRLKAIILDVDGTLYDQALLRRRMGWRIACAHAAQPHVLFRTLRIIRAYRRAHEELRRTGPGQVDLALAQQRLAADSTGIEVAEIAPCVARWMEREPLAFIPGCVRAGARRFLAAAVARGLGLAVCSDYPASAKLTAMRLADLLTVVVPAQDPAVQRLKPDPRGIEVALARLEVTAQQTLYVGDRPEVDAVAAARAGVACVILGGKRAPSAAVPCLRVRGFPELHDALFGT